MLNKLSKTEYTIFCMLDKPGVSHGAICQKLGLKNPTLQVHLSRIRQKLGIRDLMNCHLIARMIQREPRVARKYSEIPRLTFLQAEVLRRRVQGLSYQKIAVALNMNPSTAGNHARHGFLKLGLGEVHGKKERAKRLKLALDQLESPMNDPMF